MRHPPPSPAAAPLGSLSFLLGEPHSDRRRLHLGLALAAATHLVLFAVTWPQLAGPAPAPQRTILHVIPVSPPLELPENPHQAPSPPAQMVPVPDPTPMEPEILSPPAPVAAVPVDDLVLPLPVTPPPPPPPAEEPPSVVEAGQQVTAPRVLYRVEPTYTTAALHAHTEGAVILELTIDPAGRVARVETLRGLPFGLSERAEAAARQWRFAPSTYQGRPVSVIYRLTVRFTIR